MMKKTILVEIQGENSSHYIIIQSLKKEKRIYNNYLYLTILNLI